MGKFILFERSVTPMNLKTILTTSALLAFTHMADFAQGSEHRVIYSSLNSSDDFIALEPGDDSIVFGDLSFPAAFCGDDQDYYCVRSDPFHFAVPRDIGGKASWTVDGHTFEIVQRGLISILGTIFDATWISLDREDEGVRFLFVYSEQMGLVGFRISTEDGASNTYLLNEEVGFAVKRETSDVSTQ